MRTVLATAAGFAVVGITGRLLVHVARLKYGAP